MPSNRQRGRLYQVRSPATAACPPSFSAIRLVVDTRIHSQGWTRDQVVDFFRKSGAVDEPTIQSETDRYVAWPTQALSYKLGRLSSATPRPRSESIGPQV